MASQLRMCAWKSLPLGGENSAFWELHYLGINFGFDSQPVLFCSCNLCAVLVVLQPL